MAIINQIYDYIMQFNAVSVILRLLLAVVVGGFIGNERGKHGSPAGLRTHILVCLGSTVTALTGLFVGAQLGIAGDPFRISAQVISGIGFLGAGMIIVKGNNIITGLTTAAGLWATAAIGIALGYGFYLGAIVAMLACIFTAAVLTRFERERKRAVHIYVEVGQANLAGEFADIVREKFKNDVAINIIPAKSGTAGHIGFDVVTSKNTIISEYRKIFESIDGVVFAICE